MFKKKSCALKYALYDKNKTRGNWRLKQSIEWIHVVLSLHPSCIIMYNISFPLGIGKILIMQAGIFNNWMNLFITWTKMSDIYVDQ